MRLTETKERRKRRLAEQHTWFAWYPVYTGYYGGWVWLENVHRTVRSTTDPTTGEWVTKRIYHAIGV